MDTVTNSTMTFPTVEWAQQPATPTRHPPRRNMGKGGVEYPITTEDLILSTPESKINKSMKAPRTASTANKDKIIDALNHAPHRQ